MSPDHDPPLEDLPGAWADAERSGDAERLQRLLAEDFEVVGPLGYVLGRGDWLGRHEHGGIDYSLFSWEGGPSRQYGDTAVFVGVQRAQATFGGESIGGSYRATLIAVRHESGWRIVSLQLTEIPPAS